MANIIDCWPAFGCVQTLCFSPQMSRLDLYPVLLDSQSAPPDTEHYFHGWIGSPHAHSNAPHQLPVCQCEDGNSKGKSAVEQLLLQQPIIMQKKKKKKTKQKKGGGWYYCSYKNPFPPPPLISLSTKKKKKIKKTLLSAFLKTKQKIY